MPVRIVQSKQNPRLKELRRALSGSGRGERHPIGIEGPKLLEEAMRSGLAFDCLFVAEGEEQLLTDLNISPETDVLLLPRSVLTAVLATETPQPIAALLQPPDWTWSQLMGASEKEIPLLVVLAGIQDPGNLGTILRSAEAFRATGIVSLPGTVSAWNPKAVRASAGSVFRVPVIAASERECLERLHAAGVKVFSTEVRGAPPAGLVDMAVPMAFLIGNEANGVSDELASKVDAKITIPCPGPVESLNAAVAAGVLLYEAAQQRSKLIGGPSNYRGGRR